MARAEGGRKGKGADAVRACLRLIESGPRLRRAERAMKPSAQRAPAHGSLPRSQARLAAVQALYQMDLAETDLNEVIERVQGAPRSAPRPRTRTVAGADPEHFCAACCSGVVRRQREIDPIVDQQLAEGWRLTRVDSILRAILRAGGFELMELTDVPARVVISEYIEVANAFFEGDEPRVVNGVLDKIARKLRPGELPGRGVNFRSAGMEKTGVRAADSCAPRLGAPLRT